MIFEDSGHCGQPMTIATVQNMAKVECLLKDPRITENEIEHSFSLLLGSLNQILRHHLGVWKCCFLWLPCQLTKEQKLGGVEPSQASKS